MEVPEPGIRRARPQRLANLLDDAFAVAGFVGGERLIERNVSARGRDRILRLAGHSRIIPPMHRPPVAKRVRGRESIARSPISRLP